MVQGAARPAAFPRAVRLDRGRRPPARARRLRVPAVHLGIGERAGEGPDRRPHLHAVGRRDDVPQRRDAAAGTGQVRQGGAESRRALRSARGHQPLSRRAGRVGPREGRPGLGPRPERGTRHASVRRRRGDLARRDPRGVARGRGPGARPGRRCPGYLARRADRGRLARRRDGHPDGGRHLPLALPGRSVGLLEAVERRARPVLQQLRSTSPSGDRPDGSVRRRGSRDRARPRRLRLAGSGPPRAHAPGGRGRGADRVRHLGRDRRRLRARSLLHLLLLQPAQRAGLGERDRRRRERRPPQARRDRGPGPAASPRRHARRARGRRGGRRLRDGRSSRRVEPLVRTRCETKGGGRSRRARSHPAVRGRGGRGSRALLRARSRRRSERRTGRPGNERSALGCRGRVGRVRRRDRDRVDRLVPPAVRTPPQPVALPRDAAVGARPHRAVAPDPATVAERRRRRGRSGPRNEGTEPAALRVPDRVPGGCRGTGCQGGRPCPAMGTRQERRVGDARVPRGASPRRPFAPHAPPDHRRRAVPGAVRAGADGRPLDGGDRRRQGRRLRRQRRPGSDRQRERDARAVPPAAHARRTAAPGRASSGPRCRSTC